MIPTVLGLLGGQNENVCKVVGKLCGYGKGSIGDGCYDHSLLSLQASTTEK